MHVPVSVTGDGDSGTPPTNHVSVTGDGDSCSPPTHHVSVTGDGGVGPRGEFATTKNTFICLGSQICLDTNLLKSSSQHLKRWLNNLCHTSLERKLC